MPIRTCKCSCGKTFDTLIGGGTSATDSKPRCACGQEAEVLPTAGAYAKGFDYDALTPLERQAHMDHRRMIEEKSHMRDDGRMTVIEKGPDWARPFGNQRTRKYY